MFFSHLAMKRRSLGKSEGDGVCEAFCHFRLLRGTSYSKTLPFFT